MLCSCLEKETKGRQVNRRKEPRGRAQPREGTNRSDIARADDGVQTSSDERGVVEDPV